MNLSRGAVVYMVFTTTATDGVDAMRRDFENGGERAINLAAANARPLRL